MEMLLLGYEFLVSQNYEILHYKKNPITHKHFGILKWNIVL